MADAKAGPVRPGPAPIVKVTVESGYAEGEKKHFDRQLVRRAWQK